MSLAKAQRTLRNAIISGTRLRAQGAKGMTSPSPMILSSHRDGADKSYGDIMVKFTDLTGFPIRKTHSIDW